MKGSNKNKQGYSVCMLQKRQTGGRSEHRVGNEDSGEGSEDVGITGSKRPAMNEGENGKKRHKTG